MLVLARRPTESLQKCAYGRCDLHGRRYPAWTAIGVTELITEGTLLEIRVIAKRA
jgi:enamine deaminase RidA (YjgF/YER057c/UK114 family)